MPENPPERPAPVGQRQETAASASEPWLAALQEIQRQTSEAHAAYQHALADGHAAYLRTSEATLSGMLAALDGGAPQAASVAPRPVAPRQAAPSAWPTVELPTQAQAASLAASAPLPPLAVSPPGPVPAPTFPAAPLAATAAPAPAAPPAPPLPPPVAVAARRLNGSAHVAGPELEEVVISIIADLTGYPADVLQPDMELEHDLGIDSIKRVQILSRVRDRVPELPSIDPAQLAGLSSIGETIAYLRRQGSDRQPSQSADSEGEPSSITR